MSWGLAALSGLLGGLQGLPKGMNEGMQFDQRQQQIDLQRQQFEEGRSTDTSSIGIPGRTPNALIPYLANLSKTKEETARKATLGQGLADQILAAGTTTGMAPGASVEMPPPGALMTPPATGPMPAMTQKRVDPNMAALAKFMPQLAQLDPAGAAKGVMGHFAPPKPPENRLVPTDKPIYDSATKQWIQPPPETDQPIPIGMEPSSVTRRGVTYKPPGAEKDNLSQRTADMLQAQGINPLTATPQQIKAALNEIEQSQSRVQAAGAQAREDVIKRPSAAQQEDIGNTDAALSGVQRLQQGMKDTRNHSILGSPFKNPSGFALRSQDYLLGKGLSMDQRGYLATMASEMQAIKKELIGASRTVPELRDLIPMVPDPYQDNAGQIQAKLNAIEAKILDQRRSKENAMTGSRVQPPPRLAPPTTGKPAGAREIRIRDIKNPARKGSVTLAPGEPLPPGVEEDR